MTTTDKKKTEKTSAKRKASVAPFSLRLTFEERAKLEKAANGVPLGAYIKAVLFEQGLKEVCRRNTRPVKDHEALAQVLGQLGRSRLSSNLNQLARAVNAGVLPVCTETEAEIVVSCAAVQAMRADLLKALGLDEGGP